MTTDPQCTIRNGLTRQVAGCIARLSTSNPPAEALEAGRRGLVDYLGVLLAGSREPPVAAFLKTVGPPRSHEARILPSGARVGSCDAALVNGVAGHILDYDDVALDGHPSAVLFPALLAEAEALAATTYDLLRAYIAGYETWASLWKASATPLHGRGWHPSGVFGAVAASAACACLRRLDAQACGHAMALAAAQASGLIANFGTSGKSFQVGRAAEAGVFAARLAQAGLDGSLSVLEHESGYLAAYAGAMQTAGGGFGEPSWFILSEGLNIKMYPICYAAHRLIDSALQLRDQKNVRPGDIDAIELRLGHIQSNILHSYRPTTSLEAKFSAEFAVAAALVAGSVGFRQLEETFVVRPDIQMLVARSTRSIETEIGIAPFAPYDRVRISLKDGVTLDGPPISAASGSRHMPPSREQALAKFVDASGLVISREDASALFTRLWQLSPETKITALLDEAGFNTKADA